MTTNPPGTSSSFEGLGIEPAMLEVLKRNKFFAPTPIQHQAIPIAIQGQDVIGIAQTGTGKTLAFGVPMVQRLAHHGGRALIVVPTRELAYQVDETLQKIAPLYNIKTAVFIGGASMNLQRQMLRANPRILVATPGRLIDHLQQRTVTLKEVSILVLDEADRMLDMGFKPQIDKILAHVPRERQTMLFSATMPQDIVSLATTHMKTPLRIEVAPQGTTAERVEQELCILARDEKPGMLKELLQEHSGSVLVFSRTKHGAKKLTTTVRVWGHKAAEIHANRSLAQRREALEGFKAGRYRVLVATDIAARGIDVTGIALVVNYDLPSTPEDYVHRIGRTGRAGMAGHAVSFATPDQAGDIRAIERLIRSSLPRKRVTLTAASQAGTSFEQQSPPHRHGGGGRFRGPRRGGGGGGGRGGGRGGYRGRRG